MLKWLALLLVLLPSSSEGNVYLSSDARRRGEVSFVEYNPDTGVTSTQTVQDRGRRGLGRTLRLARRYESGDAAGETLQISVDTKGLPKRISGSDRSSLDLRWNAKKAYREVRVTLRDARGKKQSFTALSRPSAKSSQAASAVAFGLGDFFQIKPSSFIGWERLGVKRQAVLDGFPGLTSETTGDIVGLLDENNSTIDSIIEEVLGVPQIANSSGPLGLKIITTMLGAVVQAAGFEDAVRDYVGDFTITLPTYGTKKVEDLLFDPTSAGDVQSAMLNAPVTDSYEPAPRQRGRAVFETAGADVEEGKSVTLRVLREGGTDGVLAGIVSFDAASGTANESDFSLRGKLCYVFDDGSDTPQVLKLSARKDRLTEGVETAVFVHDQGIDGGFDALTANIRDKEVKGEDFHLSGQGGADGDFVGTHTALNFTTNLYARSLTLQMDYSAETNQATVSIACVIYHDTIPDVLTYKYAGTLTYNGTTFEGTLPRDKPNRPPADVTIARDNQGRYYAAVSVPIPHTIINHGTGEESPIEVFTYAPDSFYLD